jgi:two-component system, NarL family, sensor histidine kinase UhpB
MLADNPGDTNRAVPPFPKGSNEKGSNESSEINAWADMLSMIGQKNSLLYGIVRRNSPKRAGRSNATAILRELERERSRIARDLHAGAGQPLAGIKMNLEMLDDYFAALPPQGREALARLQTLTQQALEQVRAVSHSLHPPAWQNLTTRAALRNLIDLSGLASRLDVRVNLESLSVEPPHAVKIAIYRCAQECISNITRHSGATRLTISLRTEDSMIELRIEDNGSGFDHAITGKGIGLQALDEHASALGGTFQVASGPTGTSVLISLPLTED